MRQVIRHLLRSHVAQHELQTAAQYGNRYFVRVGRRQNKFHMLRRFFQRFEHGIERAFRQHVHFINDIDFVFACGRRVLGVFQYLADIVDTGIGSGIDFQQIDVTSCVNLRTTFTYAARLAVFGMSAIKAFRQNTRNRGFAHPARAREQISMMQTAFVKCIAQSFDNVFLSDQIGKSFRPPFSGKHLISHNSSLDNDKFAPRPSENCVQKPAGTRILTFFSNAQYAAALRQKPPLRVVSTDTLDFTVRPDQRHWQCRARR